MTGLLTGYHSLVTSLGDTTRLRLLSLRLVRSAVEATLDDDTDPVLLAAAGLIDTARLQNTGASPAAIRAAHDAAALSLRAAAGQALPTPHHHHEPAEGGAGSGPPSASARWQTRWRTRRPRRAFSARTWFLVVSQAAVPIRSR
ncbi:hypothetical protein EQG64_01395 [Streptomyces sp. S6]|nr:hypothetical protein EQG64_01395 [Streptomyces sp. S6]